VNASHRVNL